MSCDNNGLRRKRIKYCTATSPSFADYDNVEEMALFLSELMFGTDTINCMSIAKTEAITEVVTANELMLFYSYMDENKSNSTTTSKFTERSESNSSPSFTNYENEKDMVFGTSSVVDSSTKTPK
jgi:hypothetical protein